MALPDFFLFGFIKEQLRRTHFHNGQAPTYEAKRIPLERPPEMLLSIFDALSGLLEQCATTNGDCDEG
jgi:hypothetical protein